MCHTMWGDERWSEGGKERGTYRGLGDEGDQELIARLLDLLLVFGRSRFQPFSVHCSV